MRIAYIRTNGVNPDPRVEKEVNTIIKNNRNTVTILAWDRENSVDTDAELTLDNGTAKIIRFGIPSEWGGGMKKNAIPLLKFAFKVHRWLKKNKNSYDCIHCCDLPTAMMAMPYIKNKKFVYDIYDYFADTAHAPKAVLDYSRKKEKQMIEMADATIICSEQRRQQIGDAKAKKLYVIHNSPDASLMEQVISSKKHVIQSKSLRTKIVYVGNLIPDRFIIEMLNIATRRKDIELHIGGMGFLSNNVKEVAEKNENIFFYGKMQYSDVLALEKDCDILLALYDPSIINNQYAAPNKFYEALLVGKPLIMIRNTGMDRIVAENHIGGVAKEACEESIENALDSVINMKDDWAIISEKMMKLYKNEYSWNIMEKRLLSLYNEIE